MDNKKKWWVIDVCPPGRLCQRLGRTEATRAEIDREFKGVAMIDERDFSGHVEIYSLPKRSRKRSRSKS